MGERTNGLGRRVPKSSTVVSLTETSCRTRGTIRQRSKAARFSRIVSSVPCAARDVRERLGGHHVLSALLEALDRYRDSRAGAAGAPDVDLELALAADPDRWPALGGHGGTLELGRKHGKAL